MSVLNRIIQPRSPDPKFRVIPSVSMVLHVSHLPRILSILNVAQILLEKLESRASIKGNPGSRKLLGAPREAIYGRDI